MGALTHSEIASLNKAVLHLNEPVALRDFPERVFETARMILSYEAGGLSVHETNGFIDSILDVPAHDALARCIDHMDEINAIPGFADGRFFAPGAPFSMLDFIGVDAFKASPLYQIFYREMDVLHQTSITYHVHPDGTFRDLNLSRKNRRFDAAERQLLHLLQPHIGQRYRQLTAGDQGNPLAGHMALREQDWMICDGEGKIRSRGPRVPEILRRFGLAAGPGLPGGWMTWLCGQMRPPGAGAARHPLVVERGRRRMTVHCLPNRLSGEHRLVFEPASFAPGSLSRREREIARWLVGGKTNPEIAEILRISPVTAKTHVQRILAKLGVENRTAAAAELLASGIFDE